MQLAPDTSKFFCCERVRNHHKILNESDAALTELCTGHTERDMPTPTAIVQLVSSPLCSIQCHTSCTGTKKIANHQIDNDPNGATFPCSRSTAGESKATTGAADNSASERAQRLKATQMALQ